MSGTNDVNANFTADTESFQSAMNDAASAAKAAFKVIGEEANGSAAIVSVTMKQMEKSLAAAQAQFQQLGPAAQGAIAQVIAGLESQIEAARASERASAQAGTAISNLGSQLQVLSGAAFFGLFDRQIPGIKTNLLSAAESAKVFESNLKATGASVRALSGAEFFGTFERQFPGIKTNLLDAAESAKVFETNLKTTGSVVKTVSGADMFGIFERQFPGIRTNLLSAAESAKVFGSAIEQEVSSKGQGLQQFINTMQGLDREVISAAESAKVFSKSLATQGYTATEVALQQEALRVSQERLGEQVRTLSGPAFFGSFERQFPGIRTNLLSAAESAKVFESNLVSTGNSVRTLSGAEFFGMFERQFPGMKTNLLSAADSAKVFEEAAKEGGKGAGQLGTMTAGATREVIALGREAMTGQFSRIPGSFMVLAARIGNVTSAVMGMIAGLGVAAFAVVELVQHFRDLEEAKRRVETAGAFFNPHINTEELDRLTKKLGDLPEITRKDASEVVAEFARMPGLTEPFIRAIINNIQVFADALGQKVPEAARTLANAFGEPTTRGREFLQTIVATKEQLNQFDAATNAAGRRAVMLAAYEDKLNQAIKAPTQSVREQTATMVQALRELAPIMTEAGATAEIFETRIKEINTTKEVAAIAALREAVKSFNNVEKEGGSGGASNWLARHREQLSELEVKLIASAKTRRGLEEDTAKASIRFWEEAAKEDGITEANKIQALAAANRARMSLAKEELNDSQRNAKLGERTQVEAISAQQALVREDFAQWKSLQEQKMGIIRSFYGEMSAQYQLALKEMNNAQVANDNKTTSQALSNIKAQISINATALSTKKAALEEERAADLITKEGELQALKSFALEQDRAVIESLDVLLRTLSLGTTAYINAMNMRREAQSRLIGDTQKYNTEIVQAEAKAANSVSRNWTAAMDKVGSAFEASAGRYIAGQETLGKAAQNVVTTMVESTVSSIAHMAAQWVTANVLMRGASVATQNAVLASQATGATGLSILISKSVGLWFGGEASKVAASTSGAAARTAISAGETAKDEGWFLVRIGKWIATQLGMTAASEGGAIARTAAEESATVDGVLSAKLAAIAQIQTDAAVASAAAYASTAAIPIVGPGLAPAAAGLAYASVQSMTGLVALATGTTDVPKDMPAQLHQGEMVIPATFAAGIRSMMGSGGGSPAGGQMNLSYSPTINAGSGGSGGLTKGQLSAILRTSQQELAQYIYNISRNGNMLLPMRGLSL